MFFKINVFYAVNYLLLVTPVGSIINGIEEKSEGNCPEDRPYAYLGGDHCCSVNREKVAAEDGARCDGSVITLNSSCCDSLSVRCPHEKCSSHKSGEYKETVICEHKKGNLTCPGMNQMINVSYAVYGRKSNEICLDEPPVTICDGTNVLPAVQEICEGKSRCFLEASNNKFGNNGSCANVYKYLEVKFNCFEQKPVKLAEFELKLCEGKNKKLACRQKYQKIKISHAVYGRLSNNVCGSGSRTDCRHNASLSKVQEKCDGRSECTLRASNGFFGGDDACAGVRKYLEVKYSCSGQKPVDPCELDKGGCDHLCKTLGEASLCLCDAGFRLKSDGKSCEPATVKLTEATPTAIQTTVTQSNLDTTAATGLTTLSTKEKETEKLTEATTTAIQTTVTQSNLDTTPGTGVTTLSKKEKETEKLTEATPTTIETSVTDSTLDTTPATGVTVLATEENNKVSPESTIPPLGLTTIAEVYTSPTEPTCVEENLRLLDGVSSCIPAGSMTILNNAVQLMNDTLSSLGDINFTQDNDTYGSSLEAAIMQLAERVEKLGLQIATNLLANQTISVKTDDFEMTASNQALPFVFRKTTTGNGITVVGGGELDTYPVVGISYEKLHTYVNGNLALENGTDPYRLHSKFISASVGDNVTIDNVEVVLFHLTEVEDNNKTLCAFWNNTGEHHFWSTAGCYKVEGESSANLTTCHCAHLTNFALLTAVRQFEISKIDKKVLDLLSLVCCSLSIVFLAIGIILFMILLYGGRKHTRYIIHLNLMIALFVAQLVFLTGINAVGNKILCKCIAFVLHYFLLASFTWMFVEGVYLYFAMIKVYSKGRVYLRSYMGLAWGVPVLIVVITGAIRHQYYGTDKYCWLSNEGYTIWAFLGPIIAIISVNAVILLLVTRQVFLLSRRDKAVQDNVKIGLRSSLILLPILGVTWVFGMLSMNSETVVFQYIFSITNSLQGFMITLLHCFLNTEVRKSLKRKFEVWMHSTAVGRAFRASSQKVNRKITLSVLYTVSSNEKSGETQKEGAVTLGAISFRKCSTLP